MSYKPVYHITDRMLTTITEIEQLRSHIHSSHILPEREIELRHRATVEATHSSTAIEGNPLTMKQVEKVLADGTLLTRHQYAEIEVRNYKKALDFVEKRKRSRKPIGQQDILTIHGIIMNSLLSAERAGALRNVGVRIVDQDENEQYVGPPAAILEAEIRHLLQWLENTNVHPVIAAAILHIYFVSIHPFSDGNGRSTRALVQLYLGLRDYDFKGAIVLDSYYLVDKGAYYKALNLSPDYSQRPTVDLSSWLQYFLDGFLSSAKVLAVEVTLLSNAVGVARVKKVSRDEADLLNYARQFGEIRLSDAESILPNVSKRTVQRKLKNLVDEGYLVPSGNARNTVYRWNPPNS